MAVYVRLAMGAEDRYDAYQGCKDCGHPLPNTSDGRDGYVIVSDDGCPGCGKWALTHQYFNEQAVEWLNPDARVNDDGSLAVFRWKTRLGFCPQGAWVSYRSD